MDLNNPHNQSYWLVVREDQKSSAYNFAIQQPSLAGDETRYIVDADHGHYNEVTVQNTDQDVSKSRGDNFWDRDKIRLLLTLCRDDKFKNAKRDKSLWNEIANLVGVNAEECSKKYKNLQRTYIRLMRKKKLGKDVKWVHFNFCEEVFKGCDIMPPAVLEPWEDSKIRRLLNLYIENLSNFRNHIHKDIWKAIASELGSTDYVCYHKFKNMKKTYHSLLQRRQESEIGKYIKWPYYQYFEIIYQNHHAGPWDRAKIGQLIQAYGQIAYKFRNPKYQKKELWKEISTVVGVPPEKCDKKFRNLKQTYARLKMKSRTERCITRWRYYKDFDAIYSKTYPSNEEAEDEVASERYDYVEELLKFYIENKEKFCDPFGKKKNLWKIIATRLGLSAQKCDKKFRNLKQTYFRLRERKLANGRCSRWPYYPMFEKIYGEHKQVCQTSPMPVSEFKRVLRDVQEKSDRGKFERLVEVVEESNDIQRERNRILQALLDRKLNM